MLTLQLAERDPRANRTLDELRRLYEISEENGKLVLQEKGKSTKLYLYRIEDIYHVQESRRASSASSDRSSAKRDDSKSFQSPQQRIVELEEQVAKMRASGRTIIEQREEWKSRALAAEAKVAELGYNTSDGAARQGEAGRYSALKRFLARNFHPDHAPGQGIEKIVRGELFKEIWGEVDRLERRT